MINDYENLDPRFVEGLTVDQVDDIFIARLFWGSDDCMDAWEMTWSFFNYPGLDTWEKVYDKTYACILKMVENKLVECKTCEFVERSPTFVSMSFLGKIATCEDILAEKKRLYRIMDQTDELGEKYLFPFDITWEGFGFMKDTMRAYRPVFDELDRITRDHIDRSDREEAEREAAKNREEAEEEFL